jgi:hypothetical protein
MGVVEDLTIHDVQRSPNVEIRLLCVRLGLGALVSESELSAKHLDSSFAWWFGCLMRRDLRWFEYQLIELLLVLLFVKRPETHSKTSSLPSGIPCCISLKSLGTSESSAYLR